MPLRVLVVIALLSGCDPESSPDESASTVDVSQSQLIVTPTSAVAGVDTVAIRVVLRDAEGDPIANEAVTLTVTGSNNIVGTLAPTDASGESATGWTSTKAEPKQLTATLADQRLLGTVDLVFVAGPASQLRFSEQPLGNEAGGPFGATVVVEDAFANPVTAGFFAVNFELATNPGATELGGDTAVATMLGTVTVADLTIDVPGTGYTLLASAPGLTAATSEPFDIVAGDPALATSTISAAPHSNDADGVSPVAIEVTLRNQFGIAIVDHPIALAVSGTGNAVAPETGATGTTGTFEAALRSTVPEPKVITATAGPLELTATVYFYPPACTLQLPTGPKIRYEAMLTAFAVADVDGDGELDAIEANDSSKLVVRRGLGNGSFLAPLESALSGTAIRALYPADFTNDGNLDLLALKENAVLAMPAFEILRGNGDGTFASALVTNLSEVVYGAAVADFDRDGNRDVVLAMPSARELAFYRGTGTGTFMSPTTVATFTQDVMDVVAADLDQNGTTDLVAATDNEVIRFLGAGNGTFGGRKATTTLNGVPMLRVTQLDANPYPDVIVLGGTTDHVVALRGSATGTLTMTWELYTGLSSPAFANPDLDGDGDLDIVLGSYPHLVTLRSHGDGTFTRTHDYLLDVCGGGLATADLDADAHPDLISACGYLGLGIVRGVPGGFDAPIRYDGPHDLFDVLADFDGDGRQDLVAYTPASGSHAWLVRSGGALVRAPSAASFDGVTDAAAADVNGDGHADLVFLPHGQSRHVALGHGDGTFTAGSSSSLPGYFDDVELADIDNDGRHDMIVRSSSVSGRGFHVARGNGAGSFGALESYPMTTQPADLVVRDFDDDGDRDVVVVAATGSTDSGVLAVFANAGNGTFSLVAERAFVERPRAVAVADFDQDDSFDIAVLTTTSLHVFTGTAVTALGVPYLHGAPRYSELRALDALDLDRDGTIDLVATSSGGYLVFQGYPDGYFRPARLFGIANGAPVLSDFDGDGDADLAFDTGASVGIGVALQRTCIPYAP